MAASGSGARRPWRRKRGRCYRPATALAAVWRARLAEHLGSFAVELPHARAGAIDGEPRGA